VQEGESRAVMLTLFLLALAATYSIAAMVIIVSAMVLIVAKPKSLE
jgi:hypothetical protein